MCGCGNGCVFVIAIPTGSCFGCPKLFEGLIKLKFGMWSPSDRVSIIDHVGGSVCVVWSCHAHRKLFWLPKANLWSNQAEIWHMDNK